MQQNHHRNSNVCSQCREVFVVSSLARLCEQRHDEQSGKKVEKPGGAKSD